MSAKFQTSPRREGDEPNSPVRLSVRGKDASSGSSADRIYAANRSEIDHFIESCRRAYALSTHNFYSKIYTADSFEVQYTKNYGQENIRIIVTGELPEEPVEETVAVVEDIMKDGYLAVMLYHPDLPESWAEDTHGFEEATVGQAWYPSNVFVELNGQVIYGTGLSPLTAQLVIFHFGSSALKCHSYRNEMNEELNTLKCLPIREDEKSKLNEELPSYFVLDEEFLSGLSLHPVKIAFASDEIEHGRGSFGNNRNYALEKSGPIKVDVVHVHLDLNQLNESTDNTVYVYTNFDRPPDIDESEGDTGDILIVSRGANIAVAIFGEFFDRNPETFRLVDQSWRLQPQPGRRVVVNDKPLYFFAGAQDTENADEQNFFIAVIFQHSGIENNGEAFHQERWLRWRFNLSSKDDPRFPVEEETFGNSDSVFDEVIDSSTENPQREGVLQTGFKFMNDDETITSYTWDFTFINPQPPFDEYTHLIRSEIGRPALPDFSDGDNPEPQETIWKNYHLGTEYVNSVKDWYTFINQMFGRTVRTFSEEKFLKED